jgi:large subunit ribosomal protein L9
MKVILLEELKGRGGEGDVIDVATGYAVNFLLPRKIAILATSGNLKQLEQRKHNIAKRETTRLDTADKLVATLEGQKIRIGAKVGDEGQLFGSVTPTQVAEALNAKFGTEIDRRRVDLHGLVKTAGEHEATVSVYRDIKTTIIIEVVDEKVLAAEAAAAVAAEATKAEPAAEAEAEETVEAAEIEAEPVVEAEDAEDVAAFVEAVEAELEAVAETLVEVAEAAEAEGAEAEDVAEAAAEVLQEIEEAADVAIAEALVEEAEDTEEQE